MSSPTILLAIALARGDDCNFGPTHHSHLTLPRAASRDACKKQDATFFLSHGATFFCPHTYDVKLLATIVEDGARATLCDSHFDAVATGASTKHVLRPTLPAGGLPALAHGELAEWSSPVMYSQVLFGLKGERWAEEDAKKMNTLFSNPAWMFPLMDDTPERLRGGGAGSQYWARRPGDAHQSCPV